MNPVFVDTSVLIAAEDTAGGALYQACLDWLDLLWRTRSGRTLWKLITVRPKLMIGTGSRKRPENARI